MKKLTILIALLALLAGCASTNTVMQVSTIDALLAGDYDGSMTKDELLSYGDFGIGTFNKLDGEMIVLDGKVYQAKADGKIYTPDRVTVPFASVSFYKADKEEDVTGPLTYEELEKEVDKMVPDMNVFCAVKAYGRFSGMKVRSVPAQSKPYPPLAEVVKTQSVYEYKDIEGIVVGYRLPNFVKGVNVGGYHLHFIDKDRKSGGHILGFTMADGKITADSQNRLLLILPERGLAHVDLDKDRSEELNKVEK